MPQWRAAPELYLPEHQACGKFEPLILGEKEFHDDITFVSSLEYSVDIYDYQLFITSKLDALLRNETAYIPDDINDIHPVFSDFIFPSIQRSNRLVEHLLDGSTRIPVPTIGGNSRKIEIESGRHRFKLFRLLGLEVFPAAVKKDLIPHLIENQIILAP